MECIHKHPVNKVASKKGNISSELVRGTEQAHTEAKTGVTSVVATTDQPRQTFDNGLCKLLTANDVGPMECRQPKKNENNCPEIAYLKS